MLEKISCEICGENNKAVLHKHHIVERTNPDTTNHDYNLAVICSNCHNLIHDKQINIIGLFPSTKPPYGRILVYERDGISNVPGLTETYYKAKAPSMRIYEK
jgi:hypothetical protein